MTTTTWVLGASDPEMETIESLLREAGQAILYAADKTGRRVVPPTAYGAAGVVGDHTPGEIVLVECGGPALDGLQVVARCDHHRPGDPGYGRPPAEFMPASSIGQVIGLLARRGLLPASWRRGLSGYIPEEGPYQGDGEDYPAPWYVDTPHDPVGWSMDLDGHPPQWRAVEIPHHLLLVAAADHCLAAAYAGRCPGVDPDDLAAHRIRERAAWLARGPGQGRDEARREVAGCAPQCPSCAAPDDGWRGPGDPCYWCQDGAGSVGATPAMLDGLGPEAWEAAIHHAHAWTEGRLRRAPENLLGWVLDAPGHERALDGHGFGAGPRVPRVLDLRKFGTLPELPEVLARTGQCALYRMEPSPGARDPRVKIGILGAGDGTVPGRAPVEEFLGGWAAAQGLVDLYGDPARGYAGGYEEAP